MNNYKLGMMIQKQKKLLLLLVGSLCLMGMLFFVEIYPEMATYVQVKNEQQFVGGDITLNIKTDASRLRLIVDGKFIDKYKVRENTFEYKIDVDNYDEGWHYFEFYCDPKIMPYQGGDRIWLNKIDNQPSVLVPDRLIMQARNSSDSLWVEYKNKVIEEYRWDGNYFNEAVTAYREIPFDDAGIPMYEYKTEEGEEALAYHPVRTAQWALSAYNQYLKSGLEEDKDKFLTSAEWLLEYQEEDGSFPYPFAFSYAGREDMTMEEGWTSAMAQGQVLSVYARAYAITKEDKYLEAGNKVFSFMVAREEVGGCSATLASLVDGVEGLEQYADYVIYEEYPVKPQSYVLNGTLFAMVGLYDWSQVAEPEVRSNVEEAFEAEIKTLEIILPYYDYNGYSSYDLLPYISEYDPVLTSIYAHTAHIYLLDALYNVTGNEVLGKYVKLFKEYTDDDFYHQTKVLLR